MFTTTTGRKNPTTWVICSLILQLYGSTDVQFELESACVCVCVWQSRFLPWWLDLVQCDGCDSLWICYPGHTGKGGGREREERPSVGSHFVLRTTPRRGDRRGRRWRGYERRGENVRGKESVCSHFPSFLISSPLSFSCPLSMQWQCYSWPQIMTSRTVISLVKSQFHRPVPGVAVFFLLILKCLKCHASTWGGAVTVLCVWLHSIQVAQ